MGPSAPPPVYCFGVFELEPSTGELTRSGRRVHLTPQAASLLRMLVTRAGETVTRDEIRNALWADGTFVDFESAVNACISQIRTALGDKATSARYIETLPRRGYRFVAPVESTPRTRDPIAPSSSIALPTAAALILIVVTVAIVFVTGRIGQPAGPLRLGVLPIDSSGGDPALRSLGSVLQEQTLVALVQKTGKDATVVAKPAVEHLRGSARTIDELRRLDLDFLIDASVEPLPDATVRLHTKVVRLSDLRILSAQDYALAHDSLLARRHEVATELADRLMTAVARSRMSESAANLDARDRALTGESALDRGDLAMALGRLEEAVTADPANPWSRALLARALVGAALAGIAPFQETLERARLEARRVLDVDRANPDARAVLGAVQLWDEADVDEATRSLQVAVRGPGASTDAKLWLAATLYLNANTAAADELIRGLGQERPMTFGVTDLQQRVLALAASVERNPQRAANAGAGR